MRHPAWVLAYHGCDKEIGESVLSGEKDILPSNNSYDWLGEGAYFWENSSSRALTWARFLKENPGISTIPIKVPFVVGAIIDPGNCLDMTDEESLRLLKEAHLNLAFIFKALKMKLPRNEKGHQGDRDLVKRKLDCFVINYLHRMRIGRKLAPFDTVRAPFMEGKSLYPGSKFQAKTHSQWCVKNPSKHVWGYFRPRDLK